MDNSVKKVDNSVDESTNIGDIDIDIDVRGNNEIIVNPCDIIEAVTLPAKNEKEPKKGLKKIKELVKKD